MLAMLVHRESEAIPELGVVLEERVGPRRPSAVGIHGPRVRREVAPEDRRAPRRVGDQEAVAVELRHQLDIGGLPAAGARARELEERPQELHAADVRRVDAVDFVLRQLGEEGEILLLFLEDGRLVAHVDRLEVLPVGTQGRTRLDAHPHPSSRMSSRSPP